MTAEKQEERSQQDVQEQEALQYWGYLLQENKCATDLLNRLLLGIANTISTNFEQSDCKDLYPSQLASFYRAIGGDYDALFLTCDSMALAYIYKSLGALHSIQPGPKDDGYSTPTIPALKPRGFVTWQTIQLLLGPEEHVPFLQRAVQQWDIIDPKEGKPFPKILPRAAFPERPDPDMVSWYDTVSDQLERDTQNSRGRDPQAEYLRRPDSGASPAASDSRPGAAFRYATSPGDEPSSDGFVRTGATEYFSTTDYQDATGRPIRRFARNPSYPMPNYPTYEKEKEKEKDRRRSFVHGFRHLFRNADSGSGRRRPEPDRYSHRPFPTRDESDLDEQHLHARWAPSREASPPPPPMPPRPRDTQYRSSNQNEESPSVDSHLSDWEIPQYSAPSASRTQNARRRSRSGSRDAAARRDSGAYGPYATHSVPSSPRQQATRPAAAYRHTSEDRKRRNRSRPISPVSLTESGSDVEMLPREATRVARPEPRQRFSNESSVSEKGFHGVNGPHPKRYSTSFVQGATHRYPGDIPPQAPFAPAPQVQQPHKSNDVEDFRPDRTFSAYQHATGSPSAYNTASPLYPEPPSDASSATSSPNPGFGFTPSKGPLFASVLNQRASATPQPSPMLNKVPLHVISDRDRERRSSHSQAIPPPPQREPMRRAASVRYVNGNMWEEESRRYEEERRRERKFKPGAPRYAMKEGVVGDGEGRNEGIRR